MRDDLRADVGTWIVSAVRHTGADQLVEHGNGAGGAVDIEDVPSRFFIPVGRVSKLPHDAPVAVPEDDRQVPGRGVVIKLVPVLVRTRQQLEDRGDLRAGRLHVTTHASKRISHLAGGNSGRAVEEDERKWT